MSTCCKHLVEPGAAVRKRLFDPARWYCDTCHSTDGVWICLHCGHAGCSRAASHPELGGGHALHHHATNSACCPVVLDVVSQHVHCYACDDYVIDDPPRKWLTDIRTRLSHIEPVPVLVAEAPGDDAEAAVVAPGHTGLRNLGNTCFMNATVQLLDSLGGFRSFFRDFLKATGDLSIGAVGIKRQETSMWLQRAETKKKPSALKLTEAVHAGAPTV
jgi:ubiquitin carboxyl-terminal hydrolase 5/13